MPRWCETSKTAPDDLSHELTTPWHSVTTGVVSGECVSWLDWSSTSGIRSAVHPPGLDTGGLPFTSVGWTTKTHLAGKWKCELGSEKDQRVTLWAVNPRKNSSKMTEEDFPSWLSGNESDEHPWGRRFDPWPHSAGSRSGIAVSCGVGHRCSSDPALLWLWYRLAALPLIWPLAWEAPYAVSMALKSQKKKKMGKGLEYTFLQGGYTKKTHEDAPNH